jgi:hypothetical protein
MFICVVYQPLSIGAKYAQYPFVSTGPLKSWQPPHFAPSTGGRNNLQLPQKFSSIGVLST